VKKLIWLGIAFAAGVLLAASALVWHGVGTQHGPALLETRVARAVRHISIPKDIRAARNPVPLTSVVLEEGRAHWADHCAICHANDGSGNTEIGRNLYPRSPDMRQRDTQELSDGELFAIIRDGVRLTGMPGWHGADADNWKLVHFIRYLPKLTPEEIHLMEKLNPKSAEEREEDEFLRAH